MVEDAVEFCRRLSELLGERGRRCAYRLPTEAEWEYVCQGGPFFPRSPPRRSIRATLCPPRKPTLTETTPTGVRGQGCGHMKRPTEVGSYPTNPLGPDHLHGNVWEWVPGETGSMGTILQAKPSGRSAGTGKRPRPVFLRGGSRGQATAGTAAPPSATTCARDRGNLCGFGCVFALI